MYKIISIFFVLFWTSCASTKVQKADAQQHKVSTTPFRIETIELNDSIWHVHCFGAGAPSVTSSFMIEFVIDTTAILFQKVSQPIQYNQTLNCINLASVSGQYLDMFMFTYPSYFADFDLFFKVKNKHHMLDSNDTLINVVGFEQTTENGERVDLLK